MRIASIWCKSDTAVPKYLKKGYAKRECVLTAYVIKFKNDDHWSWGVLGLNNGYNVMRRGKTDSKEEAFKLADELLVEMGYRVPKTNALINLF